MPRASTSIVRLHPTLDMNRNAGVDWFEALVEDIRINGLDNPLVVHNQTAPCDDVCPCRVVHGSNRFRAVKRLGWKYVPILCIGALHPSMRREAIELHSIEEAQSYLTDGTFVNHPHGCKVLNANYAETQIYLRSHTPYKE